MADSEMSCDAAQSVPPTTRPNTSTTSRAAPSTPEADQLAPSIQGLTLMTSKAPSDPENFDSKLTELENAVEAWKTTKTSGKASHVAVLADTFASSSVAVWKVALEKDFEEVLRTEEKFREMIGKHREFFPLGEAAKKLLDEGK